MHMQKPNMKYKTIIITMSLGITSLFVSRAFAQDSQMNQAQRNQRDSVDAATLKEIQVQNTKDENRMADAKLDKKQTKAKAKDAQRIENDANDAARQSKYEVRAERRAQKSRKQANKQAEKAAKARDKSNSN
jgi:hypothetical protein